MWISSISVEFTLLAIRVDLEIFCTALLSERPVTVGLAKSLFENFLHRAFDSNCSAVEPDHNDHDQYLVPTASALLHAFSSLTASDAVASDQLNMRGAMFIWGYC